jgi:hypothetical protein
MHSFRTFLPLLEIGQVYKKMYLQQPFSGNTHSPQWELLPRDQHCPKMLNNVFWRDPVPLGLGNHDIQCNSSRILWTLVV